MTVTGKAATELFSQIDGNAPDGVSQLDISAAADATITTTYLNQYTNCVSIFENASDFQDHEILFNTEHMVTAVNFCTMNKLFSGKSAAPGYDKYGSILILGTIL